MKRHAPFCRLLFAIPLIATACESVVSRQDPQVLPVPGNSCVFDTDIAGDILDIPTTTVRWNWGGDEGVGGSDSRTVYMRALEDGLQLIDYTGASIDLDKDVTYRIRVADFTLDPGSDPPPPTRTATINWQSDGAATMEFELTTDYGWPIEDFFYTSAPDPSADDALIGYMFDIENGSSGRGFCATFRIEGGSSNGGGTGYEAQIRLNPEGNAPSTPQVTFAFDFDDLDATTGSGTIQVFALQPLTVGTTTFGSGNLGKILVSGLLTGGTPAGSVVNTSTSKFNAIPTGGALAGMMPDPAFGLILEGSSSGTQQATVRFALSGGQNQPVEIK